MKTRDVVVVGGGPCGSFAALNLAKLGVDVAVFEEHSEIGVPSHCAGHLSIKGLSRLGLHKLPAGIMENTFHGAVFHSPESKKFKIRFASPVTCAVDRVAFDKHLAEMAERGGAQYSFGSRVESLVIEDGSVKGVSVKHEGRAPERVLAKVVIDAEGISSRLLRQTGLETLNRRMLVNGVEAEVGGVKNVEPDVVELFFGKDYAPNFYAWLIPQSDVRAKVGLAVRNGNPGAALRRLMLGHPAASSKLGTAKILHKAFHPITLGGPIPKTYSNGFVAVGDAASQVKPTTGGGVVFGMTCAKIAAEVVYGALCKEDFSSDFLRAYQRRCNEAMGFDVEIMLKFRRTLNAMSDERINEAIDLCSKLGLDKTLRNFGDIDFQGQSFLRVLRNPRMIPVVFYFFLRYLSANS
jgi:digeranylgeranylglycerophospholipid reductase